MNTVALLRLGLLRRKRVWASRFPALFGPRGERYFPLVLGLWIVALLLVVTLAVLLASTFSDSATLNRAIGACSLTIIALALFNVISRIHPARPIEAYSGFDTELLARQQVGSRDLVSARLWVPDQFRSVIPLVAVVLVVSGCHIMVAPMGVSWRPLVNAVLVHLALNTVALVISIALFVLILRMPSHWCGVCIFSIGLVINVFRVALVLLLLHVIIGATGGPLSIATAGEMPRIVDHLVRSPMIGTVIGASPVVLGALVAAVAVCGLLISRHIVPVSISSVVGKINGGHRWRTLKGFPSGIAGAILDKDLRLVVRRGVPAWGVIEEIFDILPLAMGAAVIGDVAQLSTESTLIEYAGTTALLCVVIAGISLGSEALLPIITTDADGSTLRLYRQSKNGFLKYLAAKSGVATGVFMMIGITTAVIIQVINPWHAASLLPLVLAIVLGSMAEGLCVVVGSAYRPALARPALGVAQLEPTVRLATAVVSVIVIALSAPLVFVFLKIPSLPLGVTAIFGILILASGPLISYMIAPRLYRNLMRSRDGSDFIHQLSQGRG